MAVDDEVTVGSLLVLADASLHQGRVFQGREAEGDVFANVFESFLADDALAGCGVEGGAASVVGNFESAAGTACEGAGNSVAKTAAMVSPDGQMRVVEAIVASGRAEEKNILLGGLHQIANGLGKQLAQPRAAAEDVGIGFELRAVG